MSDKGYVYVLINPSMQGLVKVGKTKKNPETRAKELSSSTGIATPFQVAYKSFFQNISLAENFVHSELENKGYRLSDNREFFDADLTEIINIIVSAKSKLDKKSFNLKKSDKISIEKKSEDSAEQVFMEAYDYYDGKAEKIQDLKKARKLFEQACKMGSLEAYQVLGEMYAYGEGVKKNFQKALDYLKEGGRRGSYFCYFELANIFFERYADFLEKDPMKAKNELLQSEKSWDLFFEKALENIDKKFITGNFAMNSAIYLSIRVEAGFEIPEYDALILKKDEIIEALYIFNENKEDYIWEETIDWVEQNL